MRIRATGTTKNEFLLGGEGKEEEEYGVLREGMEGKRSTVVLIIIPSCLPSFLPLFLPFLVFFLVSLSALLFFFSPSLGVRSDASWG